MLKRRKNSWLCVHRSGDSPDERVCGMENSDHKLATRLIYKASIQGDQKSPFFSFVWNNFAPLRVKFFTWLLVQNRIQCKFNLMKKSILEDDTCELCNGSSEDANHISSRDALSPKVSRARLGGRAAKLLMWRLSRLLELHQAHPQMQRRVSSSSFARNFNLEASARCGIQTNDAQRRLIIAYKASVQLWLSRVPRRSTSLYNFWSSLQLM